MSIELNLPEKKLSLRWHKEVLASQHSEELKENPQNFHRNTQHIWKKPAGGWWFGWFGFGNSIVMVPTRNDSLHPGPDESLENLRKSS